MVIDSDPDFTYHAIDTYWASYNRTDYQIDWIKKKLGENNYCDDNLVEKNPQKRRKLY